jgi:hypothetical protein
MHVDSRELTDLRVTWLVEVNGFVVDAHALPMGIRDEARKRGLIPDLDDRQAA